MKRSQEHLKWVEVSRTALAHNISIFRQLSSGKSQAMAVVKSNAYGHGLLEVASIAIENGVQWLGVNELNEGIALRASKITLPSILIMGAVLPSQCHKAVENNLKTIVYTEQLIKKLSQVGQKIGKTASVHIKVETGLNRQGVDIDQLPHMVKLINSLPAIELEGISTHFANIEDTTDHTYAQKQLTLFKKAVSTASDLSAKELLAHCACSAAALAVPQTEFSIQRMGIGMYGLWPSKETQLSVLSSRNNTKIELKPVMTVKTRIAQVKKIKTGALIGYGCTEQATHNQKIAVLPVGYYDGIDRRMSSKGQVLINGQRAYIRGRICMNMCMVDVTHIKNVKEGDVVVLLGSDGRLAVSADLIASQLGTIHYEVVTGIGAHLPRVIVD